MHTTQAGLRLLRTTKRRHMQTKEQRVTSTVSRVDCNLIGDERVVETGAGRAAGSVAAQRLAAGRRRTARRVHQLGQRQQQRLAQHFRRLHRFRVGQVLQITPSK